MRVSAPLVRDPGVLGAVIGSISVRESCLVVPVRVIDRRGDIVAHPQGSGWPNIHKSAISA
ncbi:hypothetical protein GPX89_35265 [Nocardia sp. ET3-3]|uniref:Uncharacterized protein n=1 Tax=Nocardia terrae TaxID=2675851 RepID=A0A7K1V8R0_9NOCA|nr:hypothetical protein [Nocardia terrae]MVU82478.1 hypothetical protein [Nocardia terrae]